MDLLKERTRLLITGYTDGEKRHLEDMVASMDNVFMYVDPDSGVLGLEPGITNSIRRIFPYAKFRDNSSEYWDYNRIQPVEHNAAPRNQLQKDFIQFVLENSKKKQKLAGILSCGSGKSSPNSTLIPCPYDGLRRLGDLKVGDAVLGRDGRGQFVRGVYPQGVLDVYEVTFDDGRTAKCSLEHLWFVYDVDHPDGQVITLEEILDQWNEAKYSIPTMNTPFGATFYNHCSYEEDIIEGIRNRTIENIPDSVLYNDRGVRESVEDALFNFSPYIKDFNKFSPKVQDQLKFIIWSLGDTCTDYHDGELWLVNRPKCLKMMKIEKVGSEECTCIKVANEDQLYLTENFIVTHNTFMACYSAIEVGMKTLFIVPTSSIKQQWVDTLTGMFKVPPERVCNVRGPRDFIHNAPNCDFVVVSHASLASLNKTYDLEKLMKRNKFGIKVIDEVQMWFKNIIVVDANCNIANNWYLTGTFGRSGETENKIYQEMFGDLEIFREKEKQPTVFDRRPGNIYGQKPYINVTMVWTKSGLSKEEIKKVTNSMRYSEREGKWVRFGISVPAYMDLLFPEDGTMTPYIKTLLKVVGSAEMKVRYGKTLILGSTIASAEILAGYLRKMFPNKKIGTYHSRNTKEQNARNKAECDMIVTTTSSAGTGFDWKGLSKVILFAPMKSWILCQQVLFRNRRRDDGKECYHWDVVDSQIPQLRAWANVRADVYRRTAKSFKVIDM